MIQNVMVSGASRGIGRAIAEQLLQDGYKLSLGVRDPDSLLGSSLDPSNWGEQQLLLHAYDALNPDSAKRWVAATAIGCGGVDAVIHCAGILHRTGLLFADGEESQIDDLWRTNVMGPWWLTRAAWPHLCMSGQGRIQVLVSMSGKRCKGSMAAYPVSKFALMALCQSMRNEGWASGIRVTALCPSWVNTEMARAVSSVDPNAMTQPRDLASISSNLLQLPNAAVPFEMLVNCNLETSA